VLIGSCGVQVKALLIVGRQHPFDVAVNVPLNCEAVTNTWAGIHPDVVAHLPGPSGVDTQTVDASG
jgi:hypothetical protein